MIATNRDPNGYDASRSLTLRGIHGLLANEAVSIRLGESVVVGRSRKCDFCTRFSKTFLTATEEEQFAMLDTRSFLRVSRRHVRITFLSPSCVEVWDLSNNGTWVDGNRVDRIFLDLDQGGEVEISLADAERLRLSA